MSDTVIAPETQEEIISIKETARRIHMCQSWIYEMKRKGLLPFRILQPSPGRYFCDAAEIDRYVASCWRPVGTKGNK